MVLQSSNQMVSHSQLQQLKLQLSAKIQYCQVKKILSFILFLCYSPSWMMLCSIANYPGIIKTLILIYIKVCRSWSVIILIQILIFVYGSQCMSVQYWRRKGCVDCVIFRCYFRWRYADHRWYRIWRQSRRQSGLSDISQWR